MTSLGNNQLIKNGKNMNTKNDLSRITVDIPKVDHKRLKAMAANLGISMREIILESIKERLATQSAEAECPYSHIPNDQTIKAIKRSKNKKNLVRIKDMDELRKKLNL